MMAINVQGYEDDYKPMVRCQVWKAGAPAHRDVIALIDTGATDCVVGADLAHDLGLVIGAPVQTHNVGISGMKPTTTIDLRVEGLDANGQDASHAFNNARCFIDQFHPSAELIIGMNILRHLRLVIERGVPTLIIG